MWASIGMGRCPNHHTIETSAPRGPLPAFSRSLRQARTPETRTQLSKANRNSRPTKKLILLSSPDSKRTPIKTSSSSPIITTSKHLTKQRQKQIGQYPKKTPTPHDRTRSDHSIHLKPIKRKKPDDFAVQHRRTAESIPKQ